MKQKYLPEMNTALTITSSKEKRMDELMESMKNESICYGRVKHCPANAEYLLVDLGFNITGWIPRKNISIDRRFSVAHSVEGNIINFTVEEFNPDKGFILNRVAIQNAAMDWQHKNLISGDIIIAKITDIYEKGILVDIGGGVETFIPPQKLVTSFIKDFNTIFYKEQIINLKVEGFDENYKNWNLNYVNCPQFGFSINSTYAVSVDKKKEANSWYCSLLAARAKGILLIKNTFDVEVGDVEKATIIAFKKGVPLLKAI